MGGDSFDSNPNFAQSSTPIYPGGGRKKSLGMRSWLVLSSSGQAQTMVAGKRKIMQRTGLPARDLRILDPLLSYPSTVLGRERAIVINLEHIKAIITAKEVFLLNSKDPSVSPFIEELKKRILGNHHAVKRQEGENSEGGSGSPPLIGDQGSEATKNANQSSIVPFEFVALEACLVAACSCLEIEAVRLELEAHPALDKLTSKINTLNLEQVRQIKSRLVAITARVQKVRDGLEHLLDDDEDMAEMYLTEKLALNSSMNESDTVEIDHPEGDEDDRDESDLGANDAHDLLMRAHSALNRNSRGTHTSSTRSTMIQMLLEAYFLQIDGTLNKLSTLREYVDDTEDYINIMLDDKQNHLLQMGVMLTMATLVLSAFIAVAGVFGMNIHIELFLDKGDSGKFLWTVIGGTLGSILFYVGAIGWCKHKRLLE